MKDKDFNGQRNDLRKRAEETLRRKPPDGVDISPLSSEKAQRLFHELKVHQIELAALKERYADLYDSAPAGYVMVGKDGLILEANLTACRLLGADKGVLIGQPFSRFICRDDQDSCHTHLQQLFKEKFPGRKVVRLVRKDGDQFYAQLDSVVTLEDGGEFTCARIIISDISERKKLEEKLQREKERAETYLQIAGMIIVALDREGSVSFINRKGCALLGYQSEEIIGKQWFDTYLPEWDRDRLKSRFSQIMAGYIEPLQYSDNPILTRSGEERLIAWHNALLTDDGGATTGILSLGEDITDRKKVEEALRETEAETRFRNRILEIFLTVSGDRVYREILKVVLDATESKHGIFGYFNQDGAFVVPSITRDLYWEQCQVPAQDIVFERGTFGGIWEKAIEERRTFYSNEVQFNTPEGRVPIENTMATPIIYQSEVISAFQVANKSTDYDETDAQLLDSFARLVAPVLHARLQDEIRERKRNRGHEALRKSEERFRSLTENTSDWIWEISADGVYTYVSPQVKVLLGYEPEEVVGKTPFDFMAPDEAERIAGRFAAIAESRQAFHGLENVNRREDGRLVTLETGGVPIVDSSGQLRGYRGIDRDVTARKEAEKALSASRNSFLSIVERSADGILVLAEDGRVLYANPAALSLFGRSGKDVGEIWFGRPVVHGEVTEVDILCAGGRVGLAEMRVEKTAWEEKLASLAMLRDITERRRAEEELQRLATAVAQSAETIIITDLDGIILYVNPAFLESSGYGPPEVIGKKIKFWRTKEYDQRFYDQLVATVQSGKVWAGRFVSKRKDGTLYYEDATVSPVRDDPSGEVVNYVAVKRDITQRIELEEQLRNSQKMEAVGTLAGWIAHDFNNLLQIVLGYGELLSAQVDKTDPRYADLEIMLKAARRGADLVKGILTFSRKANSNPRPIDLNEAVRQAHKLLRRTIPKMISIELHLSDDLKTVNADPSQMEQILLNLAVNARDAMPGGGRLIIETQNIHLDEEHCRRHLEVKPGNYVRMMVSDTGCGIPTELVERIFEPFYTTKKVGQGTGLGLAMVFGIVKGHGGHILCYSELGIGTIFKIDIPALEGEAESDVAETSEMPAFGTETILVVDDEEDIRELARRYLTRAGYHILMAGDGKEALEVYRQNQSNISLVILDLIMPGMGGKECLGRLLQMNPDVKVLVASGFSADGPARDVIRAGAKGFIDKPFRTKQMLKTIRGVLVA